MRLFLRRCQRFLSWVAVCWGIALIPQTTAAQWIPQGPGPTLNGQVENIAGNNPVVGSVHTVAPHPTDLQTLYLGATNGGVWKTTDADNALGPTWTPLTDFNSSGSIGALEFDPTDPTNETLIAANGRYSSFGRRGGARAGLLRTDDGGSSWTELTGGGLLDGKNISGVAARGNTIVVTVNTADSFEYSNLGVFRSTDGGASFLQISSGDGSATGLPGGSSYDLAADPGNPNVLYTSAIFADDVGGENGIYRSTDTGATWSKVSDPIVDTLLSDNTSNLEMSVGNSRQVYAAVVNNGRADGIFRSANGDLGSWVAMDLPVTNEDGEDVGLNPGGGKGPGPGSLPEEIAGGQGTIHFSIRADPTDPNVVYVGGDRQPSPFPNSIGAFDFSGRLFRGDASRTAGSQFVHLTHSASLGATGGGTASGSAPHADSREMVFDAAGRIIEVDDGGIYRRTSPQDNTGDWFSLNSNLQVTEFHDIAYDSLNDRIVGGAQDTGTPLQEGGLGNLVWNSISTADGGDVAVDAVSSPGQSIIYSSFQFLFGFRRQTYDASGDLIDVEFPGLFSIDGSPEIEGNFSTPLELNNIDPTQILFGGDNGLYESTDQGDTVRRISTVDVNSTTTGNGMIYGGSRDGVMNADLLFVGVDDDVYARTTSGGSVDPVAGYFGGTVRDLDINGEDWTDLFVIDSDQVFFSDNAGGSFSEITGDLAATELRTLEIVDLTSGSDVVMVGAREGVFFASTDAPGTWTELGSSSLPNVTVWDLVYDAMDDILVAGTLGRGAWAIPDLSDLLLVNGDFNDDGFYDCLDIDSLVAAIVDANNTLDFDLTRDGLVDGEDLTAWLAEAGAVLNVSGNPILSGDANLDGAVDGQDFLAWNTNKFSEVPAWCSGDFNADGTVDGQDFLVWNNNKFMTADHHPSAVPEPGAWLLMAVSLGLVVRSRGAGIGTGPCGSCPD